MGSRRIEARYCRTHKNLLGQDGFRPGGGEDIFLDLFDVISKLLRLNINGHHRPVRGPAVQRHPGRACRDAAGGEGHLPR